MSWLHVFKDILHAVETAARVAAPIIAVVNPVVGSLIMQATTAAVNVEAILPTAPGVDKAAVVRAGTQATVDAINAILSSQGKPPLPPNITDVVQATVVSTVSSMKAIGAAVDSVIPPTTLNTPPTINIAK